MLRAWQRLAVGTAVIFLATFFLLRGWPPRSSVVFDAPKPTKPTDSLSNHPVDHLIKEGRLSFKELLGRQSLSLDQAASRYRERRGRHPPPGFGAWFAAAKRKNAVVVEEFFDSIHHGINPFWGLHPRDIRVRAHAQPEVIRVRDGKVTVVTEHPWERSLWQKFVDTLRPHERRPPWISLWAELVEEMLPHLPDLDMAINTMDETRILVPWEKIESYIAIERRNRKLIDPDDAVTTYTGLADVDSRNGSYEPQWIRGEQSRYWDHLRAACPPDSPARNVSALTSFTLPVEYPLAPMPYTYRGFVQNFTASQDPCQQPHLRGMHGTFVESVTMSTLPDLFPLFGQTKLRQNNELLIPGAAYLTLDPLFSGGSTHGSPWASKKNALVWRGVASGGRNRADNWWHFHRHRWVQMLNGSTVAAVEAGEAARAPTFALLPADAYGVPAQKRGALGAWVSAFADVGFVDLLCTPETFGADGRHGRPCGYTSPFMALADTKPMSEQYDYKFLPDVDGNSFSGRWRGFLHSTSVPLKATIYEEWHDDRMVPWVHFVPFDSSFMDIYAVMDYFLDGRDEQAHRIAEEGRLWAERVHRRDDMMLYVWRLLLEYGRVADDKRDVLAFVGDLRNH